MNNKPLPILLKKITLSVLHLFFIAVILVSIGVLFHDDHYGKGIGWLKTETYEDSAAFSDQVKQDAWKVFQYVQCRDAFQTNGTVDFSRVVIDAYYGPDDERSYSLNEIILYAKARGYYLNADWELAFEPTPLTGTDKETFLVDWKAYDPKYNLDEMESEAVAEAEITLEELSKEVLTYLGAYYYVQENFINSASNFYFQVTYKDVESEHPIFFTNAAGLSQNELKSLGKYLFISSKLPNDVTNFSQPIHSLNAVAEDAAPYEEGSYEILLAVDTSYPCKDNYCEAAAEFADIRNAYIRSLVLVVISLAGCLATFLYLAALSGHLENKEEIHLHKFDNIKLEPFLFLCILGTLGMMLLYQKIGCKLTHILVPREQWFYWDKLLQILVYYVAALFTGFGLLRRYKAKTLWKNSLVCRLTQAFCTALSHKTFSAILLLIGLLYLAANVLFLGGALYFYLSFPEQTLRLISIPLFLLWISVTLFLFYHLMVSSIQKDKLNAAIQHLASGETSYKVSLDDFSGKEKEMAAHINNISSGLETALQEKVRSERLKADLITNVSHDIKTPLTSIINYVDLIKRENISDPKILEYLEILDQKSQRLKNLTEDLVEASKASSGNVKLEIMNIDFVELINQTTGEFEEKFALRHLTLVMGLPEHSIIIAADGRRMWRILENLYNNAFKYAMEQSRVYVDVFTENDFVYFTIKNISANPLNIRPDELTERFVRGDVSRSTEGSGLGLSIAKSLTELQGGRFTIYIDGDFFKAELRFPIVVPAAQAAEENMEMIHQ